MQVISSSKQKTIVVLIAAVASFLGLEAASSALENNQVGSFFAISLYVYLFLIVWQTFIFDLHLKKAASLRAAERSFFQALEDRFAYLGDRHHWLQFQNYLILPGVVYWATVALLFLNPFNVFVKQVWIFLSSLALAVAFWYLKTIFYAHREAGRLPRELIFATKLYASFLAYVGTFGLSRYFGPLPLHLRPEGYIPLGAGRFAILVFCVTFLLIYQAFFQHHYVGFKSLKFLLGASVFLSLCGYIVYNLWNVNYYSGALVLAAIYNTIWGLLDHEYIDKNLTKEIVYEYLAVLFVILVIVFSTTNFAQRI